MSSVGPINPDDSWSFERETPPDQLDPIWENAFGDGTQEMYRVALSPARNWGTKGPHVMFSLTSGLCGYSSEEYAAVSRDEVVRLVASLNHWLENP